MLDPNTKHEVPAHGAIGQCHTAFAVKENEIDEWLERLRINGIEIEKEMRILNGGFSVYFRDPAGNSIELGTPTSWGMNEKNCI